jgi:hypothetical protein
MKSSSFTSTAESHPSRKRTARFFLPVSAVLVAALAGPFLSAANADTTVDCRNFCRVTEPNVTQFGTEYPQVMFGGGFYRFDAGGCVQTGGHGKTWKQYLNPISDSDLYHGLIKIPFVTAGYVRISSLSGRAILVTGFTTLFLGYEDNNYDDNGYWGHDNGTANQCKGVENAWMTVRGA